jgi:hypothetical protein
MKAALGQFVDLQVLAIFGSGHRSEQVSDLFAVYFEEAAFDGEVRNIWGREASKYSLNGPWDNSLELWLRTLLAKHAISFATTRLAIGENCAVVALDDSVSNRLTHIIVHCLLCCVAIKDAVKHMAVLKICRLYGHAVGIRNEGKPCSALLSGDWWPKANNNTNGGCLDIRASQVSYSVRSAHAPSTYAQVTGRQVIGALAHGERRRQSLRVIIATE